MKDDSKKCEGCYFCKVRDVDPDAGKLAWGPYCLETGKPVRCDKAVCKCETGQKKNQA